MKIAITSDGNSLESKLDSRFGRCSFFVLYDTETKDVRFIENANQLNQEGAGPATAQLVAKLGAQRVYSGEFGKKAADILKDLSIEMIPLRDAAVSVAAVIAMVETQDNNSL
jgi:predicted Fe-Mo cluster-binding NifX family protein